MVIHAHVFFLKNLLVLRSQNNSYNYKLICIDALAYHYFKKLNHNHNNII